MAPSRRQPAASWRRRHASQALLLGGAPTRTTVADQTAGAMCSGRSFATGARRRAARCSLQNAAERPDDRPPGRAFFPGGRRRESARLPLHGVKRPGVICFVRRASRGRKYPPRRSLAQPSWVRMPCASTTSACACPAGMDLPACACTRATKSASAPAGPGSVSAARSAWASAFRARLAAHRHQDGGVAGDAQFDGIRIGSPDVEVAGRIAPEEIEVAIRRGQGHRPAVARPVPERRLDAALSTATAPAPYLGGRRCSSAGRSESTGRGRAGRRAGRRCSCRPLEPGGEALVAGAEVGVAGPGAQVLAVEVGHLGPLGVRQVAGGHPVGGERPGRNRPRSTLRGSSLLRTRP